MNTLEQRNQLVDLTTACELIKQNRVLVISGDENLLNKLPKGNWVGGAIPYFYLENQKGRMEKNMVFVSDFSDLITNFALKTYTSENLKNICNNGFENGFNFLILPALQDIHLSFALHSPEYENLYKNPLIGIIAGGDLDEFASGKLSKTYNGILGESYTDKGVALHCELASEKVARIELINVFELSDEITIEVPENSFIVSECTINGEKTNIYEYIKENEIDIRYPLVCDYSGATINVSFQRLDELNKEVIFYAPLFKGKKYKLSKKFHNYAKAFSGKMKTVRENEKNIVYTCNCILNYLYGELDKNDIGFSGATTYGEIAYNLLNQTFTYLAIDSE